MSYFKAYCEFERIVDSLIYGVPFTKRQEEKVVNEICTLIKRYDAGSLFSDLCVKTRYKGLSDLSSDITERWIEDDNGNRLNAQELSNLKHRFQTYFV